MNTKKKEISKGKKDSRQHEDHQYLFIFVTRKWIVNATLALITSIIFRFFIFYLIKHTFDMRDKRLASPSSKAIQQQLNSSLLCVIVYLKFKFNIYFFGA
jgi:hypothetical protein